MGLLAIRSHTLALRSKGDDNQWLGKVIRHAQGMDDVRQTHFVLDPPYAEQASEFRTAINRVWRDGAWTLYIDELFYMQDQLRIKEPINMLLTQGRSKRITVVTGMQRPAAITRWAISQATHVITFRLEGRDAKVIGEATNRVMQDAVPQLEQYQWLWYHRPTRKIYRGYLQDLEGSEGVPHDDALAR